MRGLGTGGSYYQNKNQANIQLSQSTRKIQLHNVEVLHVLTDYKGITIQTYMYLCLSCSYPLLVQVSNISVELIQTKTLFRLI